MSQAATVRRGARWAAAFVLILAACGDPGPEAPTEAVELAVDCSGKCDGLSSIKSLYRDARDLDLGDLVSRGAGLATDQLNEALAFGGAAASVDAPVLYALSEDAQDDLTLKDLDALVSGLTARYGDRELTSAVNALRRAHLAASADRVFAESGFTIRGDAPFGWDLPAVGLDERLRLGFSAGGSVQARIVSAFESEARATGLSPLQAVAGIRGFVLPRDVEDLRAMKPGEAFALRGEGRLGINLGAGVPMVVAQPVGAIAYTLVVSGSLRTSLEGQLDVQLVRMDGDDVVVDVGTEGSTVRAARIALEDGWGVTGLVARTFDVGGYELDLGRLLDKSLTGLLNRKLDLVSARAGTSKTELRMSVARFTFHLGATDEATRQALAQALRGDVRLAQALAGRGAPGVDAEFDLFRTGLSAASDAGIDLLGMRFFTEKLTQEGSTVVQTPGGARTLLFESLHQESGWFFSSHGFTRVSLAGLVFDPAGGAPTGEANLFLQVMEGDKHLERDKLLDHLDAVLLGVAGPDAFAALEEKGNALERYVASTCGGQDDACALEILSDPYVVQLRQEGAAALAAYADGLPEDQAALLGALGDLRLAAQATREPAALLVGPPASVVADLRLDDRALGRLMTEVRGDELKDRLADYLFATETQRGDSPEAIAAGRDAVYAEAVGTLYEMGQLWDAHAERYQRLIAAERASIEGLGSIGAGALEIRFPVDASSAVDYERATARSLTQARAATVSDLFDGLMDLAGDLGPFEEQVATYGLLALTPGASTDLRLDVKMDLSDNWTQDFGTYRAAGWAPLDQSLRGAEVSPVDGGLFDVSALLTVD